jgi:DNA-nicking Smr family endonuclease
MRRGRDLRRDERALWAQVTRSVTPIAGRAPIEAEPLPEAPTPSPPASEKPSPPAAPKAREVDLGPLDRRLYTALKRGRQPIEASLDLHGMRQEVAHRALLAFLSAASARGERTVLVVTGKGARSEEIGRPGERGVLRRLVPHWLAQSSLRTIVAGYEPAGPRHGGNGALYVRLRRHR